MAKLFLEVVTPEQVMVSEEVDIVMAPGEEGEFGVLPGHTYFLTSIVPGELRYRSGPKVEAMAVMMGFAEVSDNKVSFLVDAAERSQDIDLERARKSMERARERMAKDTEFDYLRAERALKRAMARIKVAEKYNS